MKNILPINHIRALLTIFIFYYFLSCTSSEKKDGIDYRVKVEMVTDLGTIDLELYNETPQHRDNFVKLVKEGKFDSLLFHRVIKGFMIQGGDPDSKNASPTDTLGSGDLDYTVPSEIDTFLFHKRGVLAAARDDNPERASSAIQFYIVQGKVLNDSLLDVAENRINGWLAQYYCKNDPKNKSLLDSLNKARENENWEQYNFYNDSLNVLGMTYSDFKKYIIPESHRKVYKSIRGTPHLDQNYTVFGEVIKGMNVVDSIASVDVGTFDRPIKDVRIRSMRILTD